MGENTKPNISIRFDEKDLEAARKLRIDLPEMARKALKRELAERTKRCPTCGQSTK